MDSINQFWVDKTQSLNRASGKEFYRKKAHEHASILSVQDAQSGIVDLGCGAGELLEYFAALAKVDVGLDYSASMLDAARHRLGAFAGLQLVEGDVFQYLPATNIPVWTTTGAINQYLGAQDLRRIIDIFRMNAHSRALYLFDCIDPLRYVLLRSGISYRSEHAARIPYRRRLKEIISRLAVSAKLGVGRYSRDVQYMGSPGMGYGQLPRFWLRECMNRQLSIEIVSSRYYEYRYHVHITKESPSAGNQS